MNIPRQNGVRNIGSSSSPAFLQPNPHVSNIKMPDGVFSKDDAPCETVPDPDANYKRRQQLITFGHTQWGFKNWNWSVTKQEIDFIDYSNGRFSVGVVAFVSITITSLGLHREDIGYATTVSTQKGHAIYNARKASVTNALRETLFSFGGKVATHLMELLEQSKNEKKPVPEMNTEIEIQIPQNSISEPKNAVIINNNSNGQSHRKDSSDSSVSGENNNNNNNKSIKSPQRYGNQPQMNKNSSDKSHNQMSNSNNNHNNRHQPNVEPQSNYPANQVAAKPGGYVANHPKVVNPINPVIPPPPTGIVPGNMRPAPGPPPLTASHHPSNVSYLVQHVMPPLYSVQCEAPHTPPPPIYNTFYAEYPSWQMYDNYDRHHNKVNINMPPKNFAMNGRTGMMECQQACGVRSPPVNGPEDSIGASNYIHHPFNMNGAWIKPTIFYDGFWTEQQVKKWVTEQMYKPHILEEPKIANADTQKQMCHSKV